MLWLVLIIALFLAFTYYVLRGENLAYLDQPPPPTVPARPGPEMQAVLERLREATDQVGHTRGRQQVAAVRELLDSWGEGNYESSFRSVDNGTVRGEWVLAPEHRADWRLLYIHGGAFFAGSPRSHRPITDRLARLTGAAVFALDYRLMPEHRRIDGIEDCRAAFRWILGNGPDGPGDAGRVVIAGDSAGGSLTLALIAWVRDQGLRQADAAIAFSPSCWRS